MLSALPQKRMLKQITFGTGQRQKKSIDEIDEFFAQAIHYFEAKKAKDKNFQ